MSFFFALHGDLCGRADRRAEWGWACWHAAALARRPELANVLSCNTITWVSSLKPWRALQAKRGMKMHGNRPAKLQRLEVALDRNLGAVSRDSDSEVVANDDDYAHQSEVSLVDELEGSWVDEMDSLATQKWHPSEGGSNDVCSTEEKCEEENGEEQEDIDDEPSTLAPTRPTDAMAAGTAQHRAQPSDTELFQRIKGICGADAHNLSTRRDVEKLLTKNFGR